MTNRVPYSARAETDEEMGEMTLVDDAPEGELDFNRDVSRDLWNERDEDIDDYDGDLFDEDDGGEY
jgi:hypothetical protein